MNEITMKGFVLIIFLLLAHAGFSTNVSGSYSSNQLWTLTGSPYVVAGDIQIPSGVTLAIQPGVQVYFSGDFEILIKGQINAVGNAINHINFNGSGAGKAMINFKSANLNNSVMSYINFTGPKHAVDLSDDVIKNSGQLRPTNLYVTNSAIQTKGNNSNASIFISNSSFSGATIFTYVNSETILIDGSNLHRCNITSNTGYDGIGILTCTLDSCVFEVLNLTVQSSNIYASRMHSTSIGNIKISDSKLINTALNLMYSNVKIENSQLKNDTGVVMGKGEINCSLLTGTGNGVGIVLSHYFTGNGNLNMTRSTVQQFVTGVKIEPSTLTDSSEKFYMDSNNFISNSLYNIQNTTRKNMEAKYNWWGTSDTTVIENKILDNHDNINYGVVNFANRFNSLFKGDYCPGGESQGVNTCSGHFNLYDSLNRRYYFVPIMPNATNTKFSWTFGDSTQSSQFNPLHVFAGPGSYKVCLKTAKVLNGDTCISGEQCSVINISCKADFNWVFDPSNQAKVNFTNTSNAANLSYLWNFGQGTTSTLANPVNTYSTNGSFTVCLVVYNQVDSSCSNTKCKTITITNIGQCIADYAIMRDSTDALKFSFFNQSTIDSVTYLWAFGDGQSTSIKNPNYKYLQAGTYTICLTVQKPGTSCSSRFCNTISTLGVSGCYTPFTHSTGYNYNVLIGTNQRKKYIWDFGDGTQISGQNASHRFEYAGSYKVCLLSEDSVDIKCTSLFCSNIFIGASEAKNQCNSKYSYTYFKAGRVDFNAWSGYGSDTVLFLWVFGDGDSATGKSPYHFYKANGTYNVCLFVFSPKDTCYKTHCENIIVFDSILQVNQIQKSLTLARFYPNPFNEQLNIELHAYKKSKLMLTLFNIEGERIYEKLFELQSNENSLVIETAYMPKGVYVLRLEAEGEYYYRKLVKL